MEKDGQLDMNNSNEALFEAIRAKCRKEQWFGPELLSPTQRESVPIDDPSRLDFVFAPATEEQLQATEVRLGFSLPPLLRSLYAHVANGGFGPGTGLRGAIGGYSGIYPDQDGTVAAQGYENTFTYETYQKYASEAVARGEHAHMQVPNGEALEHLLRICDLGCCMEVCIDDKEHMFIIAPLEDDNFYALEQMPWSFEGWLWRWTKGEDIYRW